MSAALKIVATPIGNLRDISLRAIDEIGRADIILAEDTRSSLMLIKALGIELKSDCRLISCDAHRELQRLSLVLEYLAKNHRVLLISDAGCPVISDPGSLLIQAVVKQGFKIEVIPGPSAQTAALMGAGIDTTRFAFLGFLPKKSSHRRQMIVSAIDAGLSLVIYEAPLRVKDLLAELAQILGPRRVVVARELTKIFETFHRGILGDELDPPLIMKGECVVVVEVGDKPVSEPEQPLDISNVINILSEQGLSHKDIVKSLVNQFKLKKSQAYDLVLRHKPG